MVELRCRHTFVCLNRFILCNLHGGILFFRCQSISVYISVYSKYRYLNLANSQGGKPYLKTAFLSSSRQNRRSEPLHFPDPRRIDQVHRFVLARILSDRECDSYFPRVIWHNHSGRCHMEEILVPIDQQTNSSNQIIRRARSIFSKF